MDTFISRLRERIGVVVAAALCAVCCFGMGIFLAFVMSSQQEAEYQRIEALPEQTAASFANLSTGADALITGTLEDNPEKNAYGHVAYTVETWDVTEPTDEETLYKGNWRRIEVQLPALTVSVDGDEIGTAADSTATFGGALHEEIEEGQGGFAAEYNGRSLKDGSLRIRGVSNGDLVTLIGHKDGSGRLVPEKLYVGSRSQLINDIQTSSKAALWAGILMMVCSPVVLVGGVLAAVLGGKKAK
ncbi:MAG: hypothetical protein JXJ17_05340 [Anaerolineae bacterium]|nr:hypothetical protein [Anaerolineae bacterium]